MIEITPIDTAGLPELTGPGNYEPWSEALEAHLRLTGLWSIMSDDTTSTPHPFSTPTQPQLHLPFRPPPPNRLPRFPQPNPNETARTILLQTLSPKILIEVMSIPSAKDIWTYLDKTYFIVNPLDGMQAALETRYLDSVCLLDYALKMKRALDKIDRTLGPGHGMPEMMRVQFLLCGLGSHWTEWLSS